MNKKTFNHYRYLGNIKCEVPDPWKPHILELLKTLNTKIKPKWVPLFILNILSDWSVFIVNPRINLIKQKFASLKIEGNFNEDEQRAVTICERLCNDTCECCGNYHTSHVMVKNWVKNLCITCKEVKKYGSNK